MAVDDASVIDLISARNRVQIDLSLVVRCWVADGFIQVSLHFNQAGMSYGARRLSAEVAYRDPGAAIE